MDVVDSRDSEAFRAFYRAHYGTVCRYLSVRADLDVVEDVAAETFLVAWRRWADLPAHQVPWLLNTAGKCLANQRRSRERSDALVDRLGGLCAASTTASSGCGQGQGRRSPVQSGARSLDGVPDQDESDPEERRNKLAERWQVIAIVECPSTRAHSRQPPTGRLTRACSEGIRRGS